MVFTGLASKPVSTIFTGLASKPVATVFASLASKLVVTISPHLASKPVVGFLVEPQNQGGGGFSGLGLKISSYRFGDLGLKISATVSWFGPQNHAGFGLSVAPQNRRREVGAGGCVGGKLKLDGSMRRAASDSATLALSFSFY
jgi:hypothetical protein